MLLQVGGIASLVGGPIAGGLAGAVPSMQKIFLFGLTGARIVLEIEGLCHKAVEAYDNSNSGARHGLFG